MKRVYPFGSTTPLCVKGVFTAGFKANETSETITATIQVIEEAQIYVLGRHTAVKLGLLHIGPIGHVNTVQPRNITAFAA